PRAIISQAYQGRPACTYCGFCQAFGCHVGAKSSILVTKLPEADRTGNFKLLTGVMCYRVNSDNSGRVTGVAYYGPDSSDNTIEADLVILAPFIYDNTRLLLLSKTAKSPNGLANSSGQVGKHLMAHISPRVFAAFDDHYVNIYMGPSAQRHTLDDFNADNFDHTGHGFIRGAQISVAPAHLEAAPIGAGVSMTPPTRNSTVGRGVSRLPREILCALCRHHRADREPALCGSDYRSRSQRPRLMGLAGPAPDLRLAPARRTQARRIHVQKTRGIGPRDGRRSSMALTHERRRARRTPRGRHANGK